MLGRALTGALGGSGSLRSALCRIVSSEGNKANPPGWVSTFSSQWPSANGEGSPSLRTLYIEAWKSEDASSDGGSSGAGPEAEQSNAEEADSLSASTAAPAEELKGRPRPHPHAEMDSLPLPDPGRAEQMIADLTAQDPEPPVVINRAGTHNPGWKIKGVDDENYVVWWVLDLTGGRIPWADRNAMLSSRAKYYMYRLNKFGGWSVRQIARLFNVREERVMAVVALQQLESEKRERGETLLDDLQAFADAEVGADEMRGTGERHIRLLPTRPAFEVLDKQKPGKREETGSYRYPMTQSDSPDDPGWESEVRSREEELSRYEGSILAREFRERLAYNIGQTGKGISKASLRTQPPKRPAEGWSLVVRPAGRGQDYEPFVASPNGSRRALTDDEALYLKRMKPLPRRRIM